MAGLITMFKVVFGFLGFCFIGGLVLYILLDLKPWRRDSLLWDPKNGPLPLILKTKNFAQEKFFNRTTMDHIKSYYVYYALAIILILGFLA